jgi:hypothetical protein
LGSGRINFFEVDFDLMMALPELHTRLPWDLDRFMIARLPRWMPTLLQSSPRLLQPHLRRSLHLNRDQIDQKIDDQIRSIFHKEAAAVVEEVIAARRGIWEGMNGRESLGKL